jgi:hypothetical protein
VLVLSEDDRVFIGILADNFPHLTLEVALERIIVARQSSNTYFDLNLQGRFGVQIDTVAFVALFNVPTSFARLLLSTDTARVPQAQIPALASRARRIQLRQVGGRRRATRDWLAQMYRMGWLVPLYGEI